MDNCQDASHPDCIMDKTMDNSQDAKHPDCIMDKLKIRKPSMVGGMRRKSVYRRKGLKPIKESDSEKSDDNTEKGNVEISGNSNIVYIPNVGHNLIKEAYQIF